MAAPDIEGLIRFSKMQDRGESPIFVGRREEMDVIREQAQYVFDDWKGARGAEGCALLVTGCPGMGKSALLRHFARTVCNDPRDPRAPLAMTVDIADLRSDDDVVNAVVHAADDTRNAANQMALALGKDILTGFRTFKAESTWRLIAAKWGENAAARRPICLLIDEAQTADPEKNGGMLGKMHRGSIPLPILPVFAGLNDTRDALKECGLSRLRADAEMPLGSLSADLSREAVESLMRKYRVAGESLVVDRWIEAVAEDSLGFPQHLHAGMAAAAGVLAKNEGIATPEGLGKALALGRIGREAYYEERLSSEVADLGRETLAHLAKTLRGWDRDEMTRKDVAKLLIQAASRSEFPLDEDAAFDLVKRMIHDGVIHRRGNRFEVSIPSMETWLIERGRSTQGMEQTRNPPSVDRG